MPYFPIKAIEEEWFESDSIQENPLRKMENRSEQHRLNKIKNHSLELMGTMALEVRISVALLPI